MITEMHKEGRFYRLSTGRAAHYENIKPHNSSTEDWCIPAGMEEGKYLMMDPACEVNEKGTREKNDGNEVVREGKSLTHESFYHVFHLKSWEISKYGSDNEKRSVDVLTFEIDTDYASSMRTGNSTRNKYHASRLRLHLIRTRIYAVGKFLSLIEALSQF